jgi:membrane protein DedA with SNARE-associated domain
VAVNFPAGFLRLPMLTFVVAAVLGLGAKWTVYVLAIRSVVGTLEGGGGIQFSALAPLVALSILLLGGTWLKHRLTAD